MATVGRMTIGQQTYNDSQHTDMNSIARHALQNPAQISPVLTHLGGREDKKFPLSFMSEGMGNVKSINKLEVKEMKRYIQERYFPGD